MYLRESFFSLKFKTPRSNKDVFVIVFVSVFSSQVWLSTKNFFTLSDEYCHRIIYLPRIARQPAAGRPDWWLSG
jgi:hypothetical protein